MSNEKFLTEVARAIIAENKSEKDLAVVLPNQRAGLFLKQRIAELINQPVFLPKIFTIEEFFHQLSGLTKVEKVEQLFRLYESHLVVSQEPDGFDKFLTWGPTFLSDCGELDTNLIEIDVFFTTLYRDREIRNWNVADELTDLQEKYLEFWRTAKDLYHHFTNGLLKDARAYNGLAYRYAIDQLETAYPKLPYRAAWFVGFNALNRAEEALFDYVYENKNGRFFWDLDQYYVNDLQNKAGMYFRDYRLQWSKDQSLMASPKNIGQKTEKIRIIEAANDVSQCSIAAELIEEFVGECETNANTAIVLADEKLLEPLLYQLPKEKGSYNITMGKPLAQFPLFHLFDDYLALQNGVIIGAKGAAFSTGLLKPLLISPYLKVIEKESASTELLEFIVEHNVSLLWQNEIDTLIADEIAWKNFLQPKENINLIIDSLHEIIEKLRYQFQLRKDRMSIQVLFEIKKIIQQFESYIAGFQGKFTISSLRNLFKQVARDTKIPYEGEPLEGIQIMGVLETRCLDFDNLIILSANEDILPKGQSGNSFIPFVFKDYFKIQTFKDKDAIYAYTFYRLLHHAKNVCFVYNGQPGALGGGEVSRFVQQIEAELPNKIEREIPIIRQTVTYPKYQIQKREYRISKDTDLVEKIIYYLENTGISPSSIKQLINAPLDFYFDKIAKIKEPKELEQDIEVNTFGTIVHDALEDLYKPLIGEKLTKEKLENLLNKVADTVDEQVIKVFKKGDTSSGMNYLSKMAANTLVEKAIENDLERIKKYELTISSLENQLSCVLPVQAFGRTIQVKIRGKADRIQQRNDKIEIIDYKTGKVEEMKSEKISVIHEDPKQEKLNQILCYAFMAAEGEELIPLNKIRPAMQPLKSWQKGLVFIDNHEDFEISAEQLFEYKEQLQMVIQKLLNTQFDFVPEEDEKRLEYSAYKGIYL